MHQVSIRHESSPICDLPPEILEEIFIECLPALPAFSFGVAPLLLCSVCSSWRNLALSSTRLWSNISINMSDLVSRSLPDAPRDNRILCAIDFLRRAKTRPLSIQLEAPLPAVFDHPELKTRFEFFLDQFHDRIQNLDISSSRLNRLLYSIPQKTSFPQLLSITIASSGGTLFDTISTPLTIFAGSKLLKQVTYDAYLSQETVFNLAIPWTQLTHLTLTDIDYAPWSYLFMRCTNLQSGTFVVSGTPQPNPTPITDTVFPSLTHLSVHSIQSSRTPLSLKGYCFPHLKDLRLGWNHSPGFDTNFLSTIRNLESLTISSPQYHFINMGEILSILSLTPFVSELHVTNDHCSSELFNGLTYHPRHQRPLLPLLRVLVVDTSNWSSMCDRAQVFDHLMRMVGSRWWISPDSKVERLGVLQMTVGKQDMEGVREVLEQLTDAGLSLKLSPCATGWSDGRRERFK